MEMIGKDKPIYLHIGDSRYIDKSFWYVIEEKGGRTTIEEEEGSKQSNSTDEIRELFLPRPRLNVVKSKLIVFKSRIYLLGGFLFDGSDTASRLIPLGVRTEVFYLDTRHKDKVWLEGPPLMAPKLMLSAVAFHRTGHNGPVLFFAFGIPNLEPGFSDRPLAEFLHLNDSAHGIWHSAPRIPSHLNLPESYKPTLVAFNDNMVYLHISGTSGMGLSFDVDTNKWKVFDRTFGRGIWYTGVVLNSYLFLFGLPSIELDCRLHVYDLKRCTWLPLPVQGLVEDGTVLPGPANPEVTDCFLFQMNQKTSWLLFGLHLFSMSLLNLSHLRLKYIVQNLSSMTLLIGILKIPSSGPKNCLMDVIVSRVTHSMIAQYR